MEINRLSWKNFTSWGNGLKEITFSREGVLNLLCGRNGSGKSSIANLIIYMLYGKVEGFTLSEIPNRTNKNFEGEIEITASGKKILIRRGLNPAKFEVVVDGKAVDTAGKANVQKWLEDEVYGIPYNLFHNAVVLSINNFKSFITFTPKDRRDIIDKLFGYEAINVANARIKEYIKTYKGKLDVVNGKISGFENSIESIKRKAAEADAKNKEVHRGVDDIKADIDAVANEEKKYTDARDKINKFITKTNLTIGDLEGKIREYNVELRNTRRSLELYNNDICPTCGARLDGTEHQHKKDELTAKATSDNDAVGAITAEVQEYKGKISVANEKLVKANAKLQELQNRSRSLERELGGATTVQKSSENYDDMIQGLKGNIDEAKKEQETLEGKLDILNSTLAVFSESGVKRYIGNIYAPLINSYVKDICEKLDIKYKVVFDGNYDCKVYHLGREINYKTLSSGEKRKADVAVTLAFLRMVKHRIGNINILILDEVFAGIDVVSVNSMLELLHEYSREWGVNIYLVHHANLESASVDNVIEVKKVNGFSNFLDTQENEREE